MALRFLAFCFTGIIVVALSQSALEASPNTNSPEFIYTSAPQYDALAWMHGGERFPKGARIFIHDRTAERLLVPNFASSADPSLSFDGRRVVFSGKKNIESPWQVWELAIDGGDPRRVSSLENCIRPLYLPEERLVFACKVDERYVIETQELSGGKPLALTYSVENVLPSDVLRDGRILFDSVHPIGSKTIPEIFTVYSDGSGVESYRCDHGSPRHRGRQVSSGDIIFATDIGLAKFTSARAQQVPIPAPRGDYAGDIAETPSGEWLAAWRENAHATYEIGLLSPGAGALRGIVKPANANALQPVPLTQRPLPNRHPSGLHDWPNANLLCLNAYTSKFKFPEGMIQSVRVYTHDGSGPRLLGSAPVERDGSFFVQVPNDRPLQMELVDGAGRTLKRESGYFWMRRGEQRVCTGCHAGPETAPENAVPQILLKSTNPADLTGTTSAGGAGGH